MMQDDGLHAPAATVSGALIYGWTLDTVVLALWAIYVLILIAIKLPDLVEKYPLIGRIWRALFGWVRR
ncbi:hypothetical protein [Allopusillimonas ginsengisoli]|uniref:hypothetical protein n=1 Tax=Allopusillimonas ginsengisoli TaxID=453575 RepID=UPI001020036E|nr:hypothetical protein [Allopusillimonas ginsengisoli]TEA78631.1 hypothetical protein ERE07_09550 [Allopusillimonas ginsengisoli]